ncbi:MAG: hypothetical protein R3C05_16600 [Pirellulaceae bacterium]
MTLGHDLRFIKQELNEISNGITLGAPFPFFNRNSPIPKSFSVNPGIFLEYEEPFLDYVFKGGTRFDYVATDITDDSDKLDQVGLGLIPASYEEIVGTDRYQRSFQNYAVYGSLQKQVSDELTSTLSAGYAERSPNLTELYAACSRSCCCCRTG